MDKLIKLELTPEEGHVLHGLLVNALNMATTNMMISRGVMPRISHEQAVANLLASVEELLRLGLGETIVFAKAQADELQPLEGL